MPKLNLVEKLKDVPIGFPLYSPIVGNVELKWVIKDCYTPYPITVSSKTNGEDLFTSEGKFFINNPEGECLLFPSKENHDWESFHYVKKEEFKPFQKVLVRDDDDDAWVCDFFSHTTGNTEIRYVMTSRTCWRQCIPFTEENACLIRTTNPPK